MVSAGSTSSVAPPRPFGLLGYSAAPADDRDRTGGLKPLVLLASEGSRRLAERPGERLLVLRGGLEANKRTADRRRVGDIPTPKSCLSSWPVIPSLRSVDRMDDDDLSRGGSAELKAGMDSAPVAANDVGRLSCPVPDTVVPGRRGVLREPCVNKLGPERPADMSSRLAS